MAAPSSRHFIRKLVTFAQELRLRLTDILAGGCDAPLAAAHESLNKSLGREASNEETADILAQATVCARPIITAWPASAERALPWLMTQLSPWERYSLSEVLGAGSSRGAVLGSEYSGLSTKAGTTNAPIDSAQLFASLPSLPPSISPSHLYEPFLHYYAAERKKRAGVFFTPQPIANYIVAEADRMVREECGLDDGLASSAAQIVDPAAGTGVFLLAVIECIHRNLGQQWQRAGCGSTEIDRRWNDYVPTLLARLGGIEILPAAALMAKLNTTCKLAETGYRFDKPATINILIGDALDPALQPNFQNRESAIPVFLGNPPFSSLSTNTNAWIAGLVRGDEQIRGYMRADGQRLNERKTWLHDDYVKFIRLAQWHIEQAGCGVVGLVTNHGYLDNATFRLMRHELLRVFSRVRIVDLHGNRKSGEVSPDGGRDENVFGLDQGVAIGLFCCPALSQNDGERPTLSNVKYADLWGTRVSKLAALDRSSLALPVSVLEPQSPDWRLVRAPKTGSHAEYESAWSLADAMPLHATAPVTARDHFVIAFTEQELERRISEFCDLKIPDDEIRARYFTRTRSARYQSGDTRGWKLAAARRIVAADHHWQQMIIRCLYRPFDWRFVFWHPAMIDWPRTEITRHLIGRERANSDSGGNSLCLIARRQQLASQPCTFFWIADGLALDGVIRSDNRGSESLFPLYVQANAGKGKARWQSNFAAEFIQQVQGRIGRQPDTESLFAYIYALFHSPTYRERYADDLRKDFPRVLLPTGAALFDAWSRLGQQLLDLHRLRGSEGDCRGIAPDKIVNFRAGGYDVLHKWLQPRHRSRHDDQFRRIASALGRTQELMAEIDRAPEASGWLFASQPPSASTP